MIEPNLDGIFLVRHRGFLRVELIQAHEIEDRLVVSGLIGFPTRWQWFRKSVWHLLKVLPWFGSKWAKRKYEDIRIRYVKTAPKFQPSWRHQFGAVQDD